MLMFPIVVLSQVTAPCSVQEASTCLRHPTRAAGTNIYISISIASPFPFPSPRHDSYLPTALASSITNFVIELFLLTRLCFLRVHVPSCVTGCSTRTFAVARVSSLFIFDLLTVVPASTQTSLYAQYLPCGVGAILVLCKSLFHISTCTVTF